jgi:hypothetical protein
MTRRNLFVACAALLAAAAFTAAAQPKPALERIKLPPGFEISLFAAGVKDARSMALGDQKLPGGGARSSSERCVRAPCMRSATTGARRPR